MSRRDADPVAPPTRGAGERLFDQPWQAEVLGMAHVLTRQGDFTAARWSQSLGVAHRRLLAGGAPDDAQTYYMAALAALEGLVVGEGAMTGDALARRLEEWRRAYLNTPHGQPVELAAGQTESTRRGNRDSA